MRYLQKHVYYILFFLLPFCIVTEVSANSSLKIQIPNKVQQGTAILVSVISPIPESNAIFLWLNKSITVPFKKKGRHWEAQTLLPITVDMTKSEILAVRTNNNYIQQTIHVEPVHWPKQYISLGKKKQKFVTPSKKLVARLEHERKMIQEALSNISCKQYWSKPFVRPVKGIITSPFGGQRIFNGKPCSYHQGVDLRGAIGTPIKAMAAGKVTLSADLYYFGKAVFIDHGQGIYTLYGHMSRRDVQVGDMIKAGQKIGLVGATGRTTGPHLHFGLKILGHPVDPISLFPE